MRIGPRPTLLALLPLALAVTGCGTETAGGRPTPGPAELDARARWAQTDKDHVYVTGAEGFEVSRMASGVIGDDGFQVTYVTKDGVRLTVSAERRPFSDEECAATITAEQDSCVRDGDRWYLRSAERHAYVREENGLRVEVAAPPTLSRNVLEGAAERAHRADAAELDAVLPEETGPGQPVERGDLPPVGDGAPDNSVGAGG
ncbi:hypothetical protein OG462_28855 [Streptomyces sp. NBC_01077]|uniref:hypothetical protein n=1 Tax=Streptomyces sp. NBC_01077 TaxID=2903746 RepID=UPI0038661903|nr:hypothetical protein OG462_28855 [Streptomyces sp. NBC_01077]